MKKTKHIYILNYYTWDYRIHRLLGSDWNPVGYFTSAELAMKELWNEIDRHPEQKLEKDLNWWWVLKDTIGGEWDHVYEIWEVDLDVTSFDNSIKRRIKLYERT